MRLLQNLLVVSLLLLLLLLAACQTGQAPTGPTETTPASGQTVATAPAPGGARVSLSQPTATATFTPTPTATPPPDPPQVAELRIVTLDYRQTADPGTLDPTRLPAGDEAASDIAGMLFTRLTRIDPATGEPRPWLAREWSITANSAITITSLGNTPPISQTVTFKLRDDIPWVRFNPTTRTVEPVRDDQGQPRKVRAEDVVFAVRRALDPKTGADQASLLFGVNGARDVRLQAGTPADRVAVRAVDPTTVEFKLSGPGAYLPSVMALPWLAPLPAWAVDPGGAAWTEPDKLVTSGPYALAEWTKGKQVTLLRNPLHPDKDKVAIERLRFPIVADAGQAYTLFSNGALDSAPVPDRELAGARGNSKGWTLQSVPTGCTTYIGVTLDKLPVDQAKVRQALARAIDRKALVEQVIKSGVPTSHLAPRGVFGALAPDQALADFNADDARRLLSEAGFAEGRGLPPLTLAYNTCDSPACATNKALAEALRDQWQKTLGIQVQLDSQDWPAYLQRVNRRTPVDQMPHLWRMAWCQDYADQHNWLADAFTVNGRASVSRTRPTRFEEVTTQADATADSGRRAELYREAEKTLLVDEARVIPLYYGALNVATQPWLKRQFPLNGGQNFDQWTLDWEAKRKALGK